MNFISENHLGHSRRVYVLRIYLSRMVTYKPVKRTVKVYSMTYTGPEEPERVLFAVPVHLMEAKGSSKMVVQSLLEMGESVLNSLN